MHPVPQNPVTRVFRGRLRAGFGGETQRVVHLFREPDPNQPPPKALTSMCGAVMAPHELEVLGSTQGMPCVVCLAVTPFDAEMI